MSQAKLFGLRVRAVRKAAKITQEAAAEAAHLNPKYLGQIERGEKRPSFEAILSLAKAMHVSPAVFFAFDRTESDEKALRKRIDGLLENGSVQQLQQASRVLKALLSRSKQCWSISRRLRWFYQMECLVGVEPGVEPF